MTSDPTVVAPGWVGGFAQSDPHFAYPHPDLSSLPMYANMDKISLLTRQQRVRWPEFSWETVPGDPDSRCFQMFAPDISRIGYTDQGRVYSIICPQQGKCTPSFGCFNVEVTVTGQRGWVDETAAQKVAADMTVVGQIWFTPTAKQSFLNRFLWGVFADNGLPFPADKAHAIQVSTHLPGDPSTRTFPVLAGESTRFTSPDFARHPQAWDVAHIDVEIGPIAPTGSAIVDDFNGIVMDAFNTASGNLLTSGNVLSWNVYFTVPELVDQQEWRDHAQRWRESIDADHGSPDGPGTAACYADGSPFSVGRSIAEEEHDAIRRWLREHFGHLDLPDV